MDAVTVTPTEATLRVLGYFASVLVTACDTVEEPTFTPLTVIAFAVLQLSGVNVTAAPTVAFAVVLLVGVTVTFAVGLDFRTTV